MDYTYLGMSTPITQANTNGITETNTLDDFGRTAELKYASATAIADDFQYGYDRDGNVLYKNNLLNSAMSELYHASSGTTGDNATAYDSLNRLVGFARSTLSASSNNGTGLDTISTSNTNANSTQQWSLDALGNQTSVNTDGTATNRTANGQNELTTVGSNILAYDNNGNTTTDENGHTLVYDAWNRLISVSNGTGVIASYTYDGGGRRLTESENSSTTDLYYSNQWQVVEEQQSGTATKQYVWSPFYVDQLVERDDNSSSGSLGGTGSGLGNRLFVQQDANYSVAAITDASGNVAERFVYTPYGVATVLNPDWTTSTASAGADTYQWNYLHQGGRYAVASGLYSFRHRDYDAVTGTWLEQDTAKSGMDNRYLLDSANPLRFDDPAGLFPLELELNAFIPLSKGRANSGGDGFLGYHWGDWPVPNLFSGSNDFYGTDNRETAGAKGTSRIHTEITLDSIDIGKSAGKIKLVSSSDASHKGTGYILSDGTAWVPLADISTATAPVKTDFFWYKDTTPTNTEIHFKVRATDPLAWAAPDLIIEGEWDLCSAVGVLTTVSGTTDKFPTFEALANGKLIWSYVSPDSGPSLFNLGWKGFSNIITVSSIRL